MKASITLAAGLVVVAAALIASLASPKDASASTEPKTDTHATLPNTQTPISINDQDTHIETGCGCKSKTDKHPIEPLTQIEFENWLGTYGKGPVSDESLALDTLVCHFKQVRYLLDELDESPLDQAHMDFLSRELTRDHAMVSLRVVDDAGATRLATTSVRVPIGVKQHLQAQIRDRVQPAEFNGTVKRVGLDYLWARF